MRIAFYAPMKPPDHPVPSGDRRMARLLMAALELAGHEVRLACRLRTRDGAGDPARQARIARAGGRAAALLAGRWRDDPPDLWFTYHLYHKAPDPVGPAVASAFGIPYVVAEAALAAKQARGPWAAGHALAARALRAASAAAAVTRADLPGLEGVVAPGRLFRLTPFVETARYAAAAARREEHRRALAAALGLPADAPLILAVGMMRDGDKQRSWRLLARALERLADRPWVLIAVGDGPRRTCVVEAFGRIDPARLRFPGAFDADRLAAAYAAADLTAWPAVNEAYGMALLEAQAAGLPVVAGAVLGVPDVVADGETGLLTAPGDDAALADAVRALLDDPERRAAMRAAALARTAAEHDIAAASRALDAIVRAAPPIDAAAWSSSS
jgi:glycosyltransferase involved in cell wall biosynthesis